MAIKQNIIFGFQLWIRTFLPSLAASLAIAFLCGILLAFLEIEVQEFWEGMIPTLIALIVFFPTALFLIDYYLKKIARKIFKAEIRKFIGWSILWRTSLLLGIIGGILSLIPQYHEITNIVKSLLPILFSIPILGWVANKILRKNIFKNKEGNAPIMGKEKILEKIYDKQIYRLSIISFVFSVIWLVGIGSLIAIISGRKALKLISKYETRVTGSWAAKFGYIAGWIGLCLWGGFIIIIIVKRLG